MPFREIRTRLLALGGATNFVTMVVPVSHRSGGSFVARNLAAAFAFDETKTSLLIDCNLRYPSQHTALGVKPTEGGLIDTIWNIRRSASRKSPLPHGHSAAAADSGRQAARDERRVFLVVPHARCARFAAQPLSGPLSLHRQSARSRDRRTRASWRISLISSCSWSATVAIRRQRSHRRRPSSIRTGLPAWCSTSCLDTKAAGRASASPQGGAGRGNARKKTRDVRSPCRQESAPHRRMQENGD